MRVNSALTWQVRHDHSLNEPKLSKDLRLSIGEGNEVARIFLSHFNCHFDATFAKVDRSQLGFRNSENSCDKSKESTC